MTQPNIDTAKIEQVFAEEFEKHQARCFERIELMYTKKRPGFTFAMALGVIGLVSGILAAYYQLEASQNTRDTLIEIKIETIDKNYQRIETAIENNQKAIITELRAARER